MALSLQDGSSKEAVQPFLGYSPSGKAEGELVYVNYGRVQDFEKLKNLGVNVTGKIAIMRYGKIFRGNKVTLGDHNRGEYGGGTSFILGHLVEYLNPANQSKKQLCTE